MNGSVLLKGVIVLPGGGSAIYNASGMDFIRHKDWLGSSRLATTWAHAVYSKEAYAPFGETYDEAGTADRSFTGQDQDTTQGIYDYYFRRYDSTAGRWLSPDPAGWDSVSLAYPQSLDAYAYVQNQPMTLLDSDGLSCIMLPDDSISDNGDGLGCTYQAADGTWVVVAPPGLPSKGSIHSYQSYFVGPDGSCDMNDDGCAFSASYLSEVSVMPTVETIPVPIASISAIPKLKLTDQKIRSLCALAAMLRAGGNVPSGAEGGTASSQPSLVSSSDPANSRVESMLFFLSLAGTTGECVNAVSQANMSQASR